MSYTFNIDGIDVEVIYKDIKNTHLAILPPNGKVRVSAPQNSNPDVIRVYVLGKLSWIKARQAHFISQKRETPREFTNLETHQFKGESYLLNVYPIKDATRVEIGHKTINVYTRNTKNPDTIKNLIEEWYREQLKFIVSELITKWEPIINVKVNDFGVKKMKTKWGTCNSEAGRIWLNLELIKKEISCIEYIVVHEMIHIAEPTHNSRFIQLMDKHLANWRVIQGKLNEVLSHYVC